MGAFNSTNNRLIRAKESRIIAEKCQNGVKRIRIAKPKPDSPEVIYSRPRETLIGDQVGHCTFSQLMVNNSIIIPSLL